MLPSIVSGQNIAESKYLVEAIKEYIDKAVLLIQYSKGQPGHSSLE